jgi:hypothetical protein
MIYQAGPILHLNELIKRGADATEAVVWVSIFAAWALATALVYTAPSVAGWLFASAGVIGLAVGASADDQLLIVWGAVATGLAGLTTLARREKRVADQAERHREQRDIAVHLALRSLQETVPELLSRVPDAGVDVSDLVRSGSLTRVRHNVSTQEQAAAGCFERSRG